MSTILTRLGIDAAENSFIDLGELWLQTPWEMFSELETTTRATVIRGTRAIL